jgi:hypothetical protein
MPDISAAASFRKGAINFNTWLLLSVRMLLWCRTNHEQCRRDFCFVDEFGLTTEMASSVASIFGFMIFARAGWAVLSVTRLYYGYVRSLAGIPAWDLKESARVPWA